MKKATLTLEEFLSIYTKVQIGESFDVVTLGLGKILGFVPDTLSALSYSDDFIAYIKEYRPELAAAVEKIGEFKKTDGDVFEQMEEYVEKFRKEIGADSIEVDMLNQQEDYDEYESESDILWFE